LVVGVHHNCPVGSLVEELHSRLVVDSLVVHNLGVDSLMADSQEVPHLVALRNTLMAAHHSSPGVVHLVDRLGDHRVEDSIQVVGILLVVDNLLGLLGAAVLQRSFCGSDARLHV